MWLKGEVSELTRSRKIFRKFRDGTKIVSHQSISNLNGAIARLANWDQKISCEFFEIKMKKFRKSMKHKGLVSNPYSKSHIQWKSFRFQWKPLLIHDFPIHGSIVRFEHNSSNKFIFHVSGTVKNTAVIIHHQFSCILHTLIPKFGGVNENLLKMDHPKLDILL